jgi:guanylate kinase
MIKYPGKFIVISGASGAGKSTLLKLALKDVSGLEYFKTYTTRKPRSAEEEHSSLEYNFVSVDEYLRIGENSENWNHNEIYGNYYGSDLAKLNKALKEGRHQVCIVKPDFERFKSLKKPKPYNVTIVYIQSSQAVVESRLSLERPVNELSRLKEDRELDFDSLAVHCDYFFEPEGRIKQDVENFTNLINGIIS